MIHNIKIKLFVLLSTFFFGCTSQYTLDDINKRSTADIQQVDHWQNLTDTESGDTLFDLIESDRIEDLVNRAMNNNPSLQQTWLTLQSLRLNQTVQNASSLPNVDLGYSASRSESIITGHTTVATISWEVDIWGKLSDNYNAAVKKADSQEALYQSSRDTLAAQVIQASINYVSATKALKIEEKRLIALQKNETFIKNRYLGGIGSLSDLDSAKSSTESTKADIVSYKEKINEQRRALRILLGDLNDKEVKNLPVVYPKIKTAFTGSPIQTLSRRPDIKAAYLSIENKIFESKVAYKELLPSINLQALMTNSTTDLSNVLFSDPVWTLLGQLTAPIYSGGSLKAAAKQSDIDTAIAYESYKEMLVNAVKEIEDTLGKERSIRMQQSHVETSLLHAQKTQNQYEENYKKGLTDILDLLTVQRQTYDIQAQLNTLITERLSNRIDLALALGLGVNK